MSIVTKGGDKGKTSLLGGARVSKSDPRVECYGTVDELNTFIGFAISLSEDGFLVGELVNIQNDLNLLSSHIALAKDADEKIKKNLPAFEKTKLARIEKLIKKLESQVKPLTKFILYGGTKFSSMLHVLRAVTRRAERRLVELDEKEGTNPLFIVYLNRLSDCFFVMARAANKRYGIEEKEWEKEE